jgi:putative membrane protein
VCGGQLLLVDALLKGVSFHPWYWVFVAAALLGLFNAILRPIIIFLTLPITIITFGFFIFVVNALLFWLTALLMHSHFKVDNFLWAFAGAFLYALFGVIIHMVAAIGETSERALKDA